jgi:hypothetical protein
LHADLDRFEGAEEDVGDELGGGGGAEVDDCLGGVGEELLAVVVFEDFVGAVFACALEGVADEGWGLAVLVQENGKSIEKIVMSLPSRRTRREHPPLR